MKKCYDDLNNCVDKYEFDCYNRFKKCQSKVKKQLGKTLKPCPVYTSGMPIIDFNVFDDGEDCYEYNRYN